MLFSRMTKFFIVAVVMFMMLLGCQSSTDGEPANEENGVAEAATAVPTDTPAPTNTAVPPTTTDESTAMAEPTIPPTIAAESANTSEPQKPTATAIPDKSNETPATDSTTTEDESGDNEAEGSDTVVMGDAMDIVLDSEERSRKLDTFRVQQNMTMATEGFALAMVQTCATELPDISYCRTESTTTIEGLDEPVVSVNEVLLVEDAIWINFEEAGWEVASDEEIEAMGLEPEALTERFALSTYMVEAELVGETTINDQPVHEIEFTLDFLNYIGDLMGEEMGAAFAEEAEDVTIEGTIWIGTEDLLPSKATINMNFMVEGQELDINSQVAYLDYNEPVDIPDPTTE